MPPRAVVEGVQLKAAATRNREGVVGAYGCRVKAPARYQSDDEDSARWSGFPFRQGDIVISTRSKSGTIVPPAPRALSSTLSPKVPPRVSARSGSPFEDRVGFSRAVRVGDRIVVSGTAPIWPDGSCDEDAYIQTVRCLEIIATSLADVGSSMTDVVRTRMYLVDAGDASAVGRAHAASFGSVRPAATMVVVAGLLDPRWRVEIEVDAVVGSGAVPAPPPGPLPAR
jgi:enamine deaminase RidA (YjgF/YER057c/UK114 family)